MAKPVVLWLESPVQQPVVAVALPLAGLPGRRERGPGVEGDDMGAAEGTPARMLIMATADASLSALGLSNGQYIGARGGLHFMYGTLRLA